MSGSDNEAGVGAAQWDRMGDGHDGDGDSRVIGWTMVTLTGHENQLLAGRGPFVDACG